MAGHVTTQQFYTQILDIIRWLATSTRSAAGATLQIISLQQKLQSDAALAGTPMSMYCMSPVLLLLLVILLAMGSPLSRGSHLSQ